jgi:NAD(P)-dependent dehydrogenase (short-subunit alcohol dehydrogenase family)
MNAIAAFREDLFKGQTVLVTGGGRGIGAGIADAFAACGASVALHDVDQASVAAKAAEIRSLGTEVATFIEDLSRKGAAAALMDAVIARMGEVHVLVNNAGRSWAVTTEDMDERRAEELVELNQMAVLWLSKAFILHRRSFGGGGSIVQISSTAGMSGFANRAVYAATKHAIQGLTRVLAIDHGAEGIRVNSVLPHVIETPMFNAVASAAEGATWQSSIPMRRLGTPDDIAGAVLFLCSPAAAYVTGSGLVVDGGAMAGI